jgi:hypothetical protein
VKLLATLPNLRKLSSKNKTFAAFQIQEKPENNLAEQNLKNLKEHVDTQKQSSPKNVFLHRAKRLCWRLITTEC